MLLICFVISGACAAFGGMLLAGWSNRSFQAMGDPYLLPTIAAVVLGGTNVLGGRGTYLGTVAGVILITLLQSILSVVQPQLFFADWGSRCRPKVPPDGFRGRHHRHAAALRPRAASTLEHVAAKLYDFADNNIASNKHTGRFP